jgi:hypothetical protein
MEDRNSCRGRIHLLQQRLRLSAQQALNRGSGHFQKHTTDEAQPNINDFQELPVSEKYL